ncbi:class I SAM-dependent methyltransferase [Burkholderia sp. LS-044]|uniref:class I SAM-dependent methyltransferase n=1 Tax=Burkholderia sp. LS-044 TaxID=1459967 RepID=UPI0010A5E866|nr:class I SAM-dependent methyltransferase [Burkholderia sp. LS-044]THJ46001.1 class I SAM-dependent methyltransferase [Burkholderia sp. LS-044]
MNQDAAAQFDELAALYEDMASWPFRQDIEIPSVLENIGKIAGLSVVDFGCGTGMYGRWLKANGAARVIGYDLAPGMLNYARRRAEKEKLEISFTSTLGAELTDQFDIVLAVYVLPYARTRTELYSMCADMARLLRPGGRLIALPIHPNYSPSPDYYESYGFRLVADDHLQAPYADAGRVRLELCIDQKRASVDAWYWSEQTLKEVLAEAGFVNVSLSNPTPIAFQKIYAAPSNLQTYLKQPHTIIINAHRG